MTYEFGGASHLRQVLTPEWCKREIMNAVDVLRDFREDFDTIAISGLSGLLYGAPLAYLLNKPLMVVRKKQDVTTHGAKRLEGNYGLRRYLVVDDTICTGDTLRYIVENIGNSIPEARCVGLYTFDTDYIYKPRVLSVSYQVPEEFLELRSSVAGEKLSASLGEVARGL
jgi:hypoxanthine phosphoribosyltransferase